MGKNGAYIISLFFLSLSLIVVNPLFVILTIILIYHIVGEVHENHYGDIVKIVVAVVISILMTPGPTLSYALILSLSRGKVSKKMELLYFTIVSFTFIVGLIILTETANDTTIGLFLYTIKYLIAIYCVRILINCIINIRFKKGRG